MAGYNDPAAAQQMYGQPPVGGADESEPTFPLTPAGLKMAEALAKKMGGTVKYCVDSPQTQSSQNG